MPCYGWPTFPASPGHFLPKREELPERVVSVTKRDISIDKLQDKIRREDGETVQPGGWLSPSRGRRRHPKPCHRVN